MPSPVVFALDFPTVDEARDAAREVAPAVGMLKVGLELFVGAGPAAIQIGREAGLPIFLDLKLHDIPETVERAVAQASALGAALVTVHASGGRAMLKRAVNRALREGGTLAVCAVTILTSLDDQDLDDVGLDVTQRIRPFNEAKARAIFEGQEIERSRASIAAEGLAMLAYEEGVRWFVCSPAEVGALRARLGAEAVLVTPGVRPLSSTELGDQKRVATPAQAIRDGADWLVVGRPIRDAANRREAAQAITDEATAAASEKASLTGGAR